MQKNQDGSTSFLLAVLSGDVDIVTRFLEHRNMGGSRHFDVDQRHDIEGGVVPETQEIWSQVTAIMVASKQGYLEIVRVLGDAGANVNAVDGNHQSSIYHALPNNPWLLISKIIYMNMNDQILG